MSKKGDPFSFLKEGHDPEFDNAMGKINVMYDDIFKSEVSDDIFRNIQTENNEIL